MCGRRLIDKSFLSGHVSGLLTARMAAGPLGKQCRCHKTLPRNLWRSGLLGWLASGREVVTDRAMEAWYHPSIA